MSAESTRPARVIQGFGAFFILLAIGLGTWDLITAAAWVSAMNIVTLASGALMLYLGTVNVRRTREHNERMQALRGRGLS